MQPNQLRWNQRNASVACGGVYACSGIRLQQQRGRDNQQQLAIEELDPL